MMRWGLLLRRSFNPRNLCKRSLFNEKFLGLDAYKTKRNQKLASQEGENLKNKLRKACEDPALQVLTHQIKQIAYVIETAEEVQLVEKGLEKYCCKISKGNPVFQNYRIGPELMRMYWCLNLPVEGLSLLTSPSTSHFFHDIKSYLILQDLLYNHEMYDEVCEIFRMLQEKQIEGRRIPFLNYILFQAACYKKNSKDTYDDAMKVFEEFITFCPKPMWPLIMYTLIHALENGNPELSLKYALGNDNVSMNLRLAALIKTGGVSQALQYFNELPDKSKVIKSVASDLFNNLENAKKTESSNATNLNIKNINIDSFKNQTFEELAAQKIYSMEKVLFSSD